MNELDWDFSLWEVVAGVRVWVESISSMVVRTSTWFDGWRLAAGCVIVRPLLAVWGFSLMSLMMAILSEVQTFVGRKFLGGSRW